MANKHQRAAQWQASPHLMEGGPGTPLTYRSQQKVEPNTTRVIHYKLLPRETLMEKGPRVLKHRGSLLQAKAGRLSGGTGGRLLILHWEWGTGF